jgi:peptidoglycan/xylan/chitin deacetylase (PgdA/CDA1 family)
MNNLFPWLIAAPTALAGLSAMAAYGAVHPSSQLFGPTISATSSARKLAITFDDGPNPALTPRLLDLLDRYNAKATFFLIGKFVRQAPSLTKEIYARGHLLGNHTDTHPNLFFCGPRDTQCELQGCSEAILHATWESTRWFRPPYGFRSPWLGEIAHRAGLRTAMWTLLPGDWKEKPLDWLKRRMEPIEANAKSHWGDAGPPASSVTGDVLCLHDGDASHPDADRSHTLSALEYWLPRWRDLGLEFVTMAQAAEGSA